MKNKTILSLFVLLAVSLLPFAALAQTNGTVRIEQSVVANGGGTSSSNLFSITGTVGQPSAGTLSSGGTFSLEGGFWAFPSNVGSSITISGQITSNGNPLQNVTVLLSGLSTASTTTDSFGNFVFSNLTSGGSFTVTPSFANYIFSPPSSTFDNLASNQTANFTATQCSYTINPTTINALPAGANGSVSITATSGCAWTAVSNYDWIAVTAGDSGIGDQSICYSIAANTGAARTGTITIAGQTFTVNQAAKFATITTVTASNAAYDGNPHGGTAAVTGEGGLNQSLIVTYSGRNLTNYPATTIAPTNAGDYTASATFVGDANYTGSSDSKDFTIGKAQPTVSFTSTAPATLAYNETYTPTAETNSDGALTINASGACSISNGVVTINSGLGNCTVTASVTEGENHLSGSAIQQITASKADQTITLTDVPETAIYNSSFNVTASASSGLPVTIISTGACSNEGTKITLTSGTGTCTITALQPGDDNYNAAADVEKTVEAKKEIIPPVIDPISNVVVQLPPNSNDTLMIVTFPLPTATDNSGAEVIVETDPVSGSTFPVGTTTVNVTATDTEGNQSFATFIVIVQYRFSMFYYSDLLLSEQALNQVTAGSDLPIRFSLSGYKGDPYSSPPVSQQISCSTLASTGPSQVINRYTPDPYYSSLYDFYQTTWRTQAAWKFTCRRLILNLNDGTTKSLNFYFK